VKTRSEELQAIAETIKLISDDDALELFKKTLPSQSSSFLQMQEGLATARRAQALIRITEAKQTAVEAKPGLDFLVLALQGKNSKVNLDKVVKMIDQMVATLKQEQSNENDKQQFCTKQFDQADDTKKDLERKASDLDSTISKEEDALSTLNDEIKTVEDGIKALDKGASRHGKNSSQQVLSPKHGACTDQAAPARCTPSSPGRRRLCEEQRRKRQCALHD
jgi:uncharacterized phage infection (PIP) family protein YhgE